MRSQIIFVTGTDTGVGKTVFASMLTRHLASRDACVAALKPLCSGGRQDARALCHAARGVLPLNAVNPWHFRAALSPLVAARKERRRVPLAAVVEHVQECAQKFAIVIVEGAGGLLSPLGPGFDSRDLIGALGAETIVVAANRLGAVNQVLLTVEALAGAPAQVVFMSPPRSNPAARSNPALVREILPSIRVWEMPWLNAAQQQHPPARVRSVLQRMLAE